MNTDYLMQELLELTRDNLNTAENFKAISLDELNYKPEPQSWSVLECIEHLNRYGDFYIPEITKKIASSKFKNTNSFKSNWLGRYFVKSVSYASEIKKMKTFKSMNPIGSNLNINTLDKFIKQQHQFLDLLNKAKNVNLDKTKTAISISKWIPLKLGDTFRVVIYHNERHIMQARNILKRRSNAKNKQVI